MKLSGTLYELWEHQRASRVAKRKQPLYRNDRFMPPGTAVDVSSKMDPDTFLTTPMTEPDGRGYAARPPTSRTTMASAYMEKVKVAFCGCVWHIGGGNAYNITPAMARDDDWYLVDAEKYPHDGVAHLFR